VALFQRSTDPEKTAQRDLTAARTNRDALTARLKASEAAVATYREKARVLARDAAADGDLDHVENEMRRSQDRTETLRTAIGDVERNISELEATLAEIADDKQRAETSAAIGVLVDRWATAAAAFDVAARELEAISRKTAPIVLDANGTTVFVMAAREQLPPAIAVIVTGLKAHAKAVIDGKAKATLPKVDAPAPRPQPVAPPPVERVFLLKHVKFIDGNGNLRRLPKMNPADLKPAHAARALKRAWAVSLNDPRVRALAGTYGAQIPDLHQCEDLDGDTASPAAGPTPSTTVIRHSAFAPHPGIGPAITGTMPTRPAEPMTMAATRSAPNTEAPDDEG
jgi:hypothetical protein